MLNMLSGCRAWEGSALTSVTVLNEADMVYVNSYQNRIDDRIMSSNKIFGRFYELLDSKAAGLGY